MGFIILTFALKLAFVTNQTDYLYEIDHRFNRCVTENYYYVDGYLQADIFDLFFIKGKINVPVLKNRMNFTFSPFNIGSTISAGIYYSIFEIGWMYYCLHPIIPYHFLNYAIQYEGSHNEFYLQIKGKI